MMTDLIVDFPQRARLASKRETKKRVRFASHMSISYYEGSNASNAGELHYTSDDYRSFKAANRGDVVELSKRYLALTSGDESGVPRHVSVLQGYDFMGLENMLTPRLIKRSNVWKQVHKNAVLDEQERQDKEGGSDPEKLAGVSEEHSRRSARRAAMIGMMHRQR